MGEGEPIEGAVIDVAKQNPPPPFMLGISFISLKRWEMMTALCLSRCPCPPLGTAWRPQGTTQPLLAFLLNQQSCLSPHWINISQLLRS